MKKVKMMLTAIGILAVVGGAVAFKVAKFGGSTYCTAPGGSAFCPTKTPFFSASFIPGPSLEYRQIFAVVECSALTICTGTGNMIN